VISFIFCGLVIYCTITTLCSHHRHHTSKKKQLLVIPFKSKERILAVSVNKIIKYVNTRSPLVLMYYYEWSFSHISFGPMTMPQNTPKIALFRRLLALPKLWRIPNKNLHIGISGRPARTSREDFKRDKDRKVFEHTLDVQLGAPLASSSVYFTYERGRIGVVTVHSFLLSMMWSSDADLPSRPMQPLSWPQLSPMQKTWSMLPNSPFLASLISRIPLG